MKLNKDFYSRDTLTVARELLGKILVHNVDGKQLKGKIVETEAYLGLRDKAAHSYGGRRTERVRVMYGPPGRAYVYLIYGIYYCLNMITVREGVPEGVLIRALEAMENIDEMARHRYGEALENLSNNKRKNLSNGPGKLTMAMKIDKSLNGASLLENKIYVIDGKDESFNIVETKRIGIDYAEEARDYPYRFYIEGNPNVSKL